MQMLWAGCIPPGSGLYASVAKLSAACFPCSQLREMGILGSQSPTASFSCLHWEEMAFKGAGQPA